MLASKKKKEKTATAVSLQIACQGFRTPWGGICIVFFFAADNAFISERADPSALNPTFPVLVSNRREVVMHQLVLKRGERGTSSFFFFLKLVLQIKGKSGHGDADVKAAVCVFVVSLSHLKWVAELSGCQEGTCVLSKTGICAPISPNTQCCLTDTSLK